MNIIVCIKQVPNVNEVKWDPITGSLIRTGVPSIINPNDKNAIEAALELREKHGGQVTVMCMGPSQVEEALREALGMGADNAIQITDRQFAGADTWATSHTLGRTIQKCGTYDLIICGKEALDGMTAQVGPQLAEYLSIPQLTYVEDIKIDGRKLVVTQKMGEYTRKLEAEMPALITVERTINEPRISPLDAVMEAMCKEIPKWDADYLEADPDAIGLKGSPTRLKKVYTPKLLKGAVEIMEGSLDQAVCALVENLQKRCLI